MREEKPVLKKVGRIKKRMNKEKTKLLFISRTYPPMVGGMENVSYNLINSVARLKEVKTTAIVNRRGKSYLPFFFLMLIPKLIFSAKKYDLIHFSDGVLAPIGEIIKLIFPKKKIVCTIHGLDITYAEKNSFYRHFNIKAMQSLDKIIAVSEATKRAAMHFEIPENKIVVIPNGVNPLKQEAASRKQLLKLISGKYPRLVAEKLKQKQFILTVGRLCKRKGVAWFIQEVMPKLDKNIMYLIAGSGPEKETIAETIKTLKLDKSVLLLGPVTEKEKSILLGSVALFIQPNIKVKGDMEGFGVSMLEAAVAKVPVVASKIEGIKQAIIHKKNGFLIKPKNSGKFIMLINWLIQNKEERILLGEKFQKFTLENFSWNKISREYYTEFIKTIKEG